MPYGVQVLTTQGLVDITNTLALRFLGRSNHDLPRGAQFKREVDFNLPREFRSDLGNGPVLLCAAASRVPPAPFSPNGTYELSVKIRADNYYYANASNVPSTIRLQINSNTAPGETDSYADITIMAVQL